MPKAKTPPPDLDGLYAQTTTELRQRYLTVFGEPTPSRNRTALIRRIAWRLQELAEGGLSERARRRAAELADEAEFRILATRAASPATSAASAVPPAAPRDPRLPAPGLVIARSYKGTVHEVLVGETDLEYAGERFDSLSAVAKRITGTHPNGFRFFQLTRGARS